MNKPTGTGFKSVKDGGPRTLGAAYPTRTLAEQFARKCVHFTGLRQDRCEAGVSYADVREEGEPGRGFLLPCFNDDNCSRVCPLAQFPTKAEVEEQVADAKRRTLNVVKAREAITEATKGQRSVAGRIQCPVCESGSLGFSVAFNGHVHARCSTQGCVSWME